jgi:hypothetical protein
MEQPVDRLSLHEQICTLRYKVLEEKMDNLGKRLNWMAASVWGLLVGLVGWMAFQLYTLEPLRAAAIMATQRH